MSAYHDPVRDLHVVPALMTRPYADHGQQGHLVYNVQPASTKIVRNALVAKPTDVAEALTSMGPQRRCDRGDVVVMPLQGNAYCRHAPTAGFGIGDEGDPSYTLKGDNDASVVVTERVTPLQHAEATNSGQEGSGVGEEGAPSYTLTTRRDAGVFVAPIQDGENVAKEQNGTGVGADGDPMFTLTAAQRQAVAVDEPVSFDPAQVTHPENRSKCEPGQPATSLTESGRPHVAYRSVVRRLTPREYERLQGMPDDFTLIEWRGKPASDGRRYKAVGNSMAVPVMKWLGRRILMVEEILRERRP